MADYRSEELPAVVPVAVLESVPAGTETVVPAAEWASADTVAADTVAEHG